MRFHVVSVDPPAPAGVARRHRAAVRAAPGGHRFQKTSIVTRDDARVGRRLAPMPISLRSAPRAAANFSRGMATVAKRGLSEVARSWMASTVIWTVSLPMATSTSISAVSEVHLVAAAVAAADDRKAHRGTSLIGLTVSEPLLELRPASERLTASDRDSNSPALADDHHEPPAPGSRPCRPDCAGASGSAAWSAGSPRPGTPTPATCESWSRRRGPARRARRSRKRPAVRRTRPSPRRLRHRCARTKPRSPL